MKTFLLSLIAACIACMAACGSEAPPPPPAEKPDAPPKDPPRRVRVLVAPFENGMRGKDTDYYSIGLALAATSRFEELSVRPALLAETSAAGFTLETVVGPHVLTDAQVRLRPTADAPLSEADAVRLAKSEGAQYVLTGRYEGRVEKWKLTVTLDEVVGDRLVRKGEHAAEASIYATSKQNPAHPGVQMSAVHGMLGEGVAATLASAGVVMPPAAAARLREPLAPDAMPFINLARAYAAFFEGSDDGVKRALAKAEDAVRGWPDLHEAQRLYGYLLWQSGKAMAARQHYQEVLDPIQPGDAKKPRRIGDPDDIRALIMLGRIELESGQSDAAIGYLERAAKIRPDDARVQFWIGDARAKLGETDKAIARYELSKQLDPNGLETRKALAGLYAATKRYGDASQELSFVVGREPENVDAVFLLAACLRASGAPEKALDAYAEASARFPKDGRLRKFRGDALLSLGRIDEARAAYAEAAKLLPKDVRLQRTAEDVRYGAELAKSVLEATALKADMERLRAEIQDAVNDATWDLAWNGKAACEDGRAGSSFLLARKDWEDYDRAGAAFLRLSGVIDASLKNGEGLALTPDELASGEDLLRYGRSALRDRREILSAERGTLKPLLSRHGCSTDPDRIHVASIDGIHARNKERYVTMPEPPKRDNSGISPVVPDGAIGNVSFFVENRSGKEYVLVLDGKPMEPAIDPIPADKLVALGGKPAPRELCRKYSAALGYHAFCLRPRDRVGECEEPKNVGRDYIHEGWTPVIQ